MISHLFTDTQLQRIHDASLAILARTGVIIPHPEMLRRLADLGARVEFAEQRVYLPAELVERLVRQAGKQFTLYGRDRAHTARFGFGARNYNSTAGQASWVDQPGTQRRYATITDVVTAACVGDALPHLNIVGAMADPHELPISYRCVEVLATLLAHTTKPVTFWFHDRASAHYIVEMLIALRGSAAEAAAYPLCYPLLEPISPLRFPFHGIDLLFETARVNMPVPVGPMAQMGLTAPGTVAGTMALQNAEILAGICITQAVQPGMPVCYGGICHAFDMATTQTIFGGPEQVLFSVGLTQLGKFYGLPVYVNAGLTDAKRADAQAGLEVGMTLSFAAAAGADIFGHLGIAGADQGASLELLLMQHEAISYVESLLRQVEISDDTLGLDILAEVGPGGSFIEQEHTADHFRQELWFPQLCDRNFYQAWLDAGAQDMETRCKQRLEEIRYNHQPEPLPDELQAEFTRILATARENLQGA